jgi:hypothetical protein
LCRITEQAGQPLVDEDETVILNDVHADQRIAAQATQQGHSLMQQTFQDGIDGVMVSTGELAALLHLRCCTLSWINYSVQDTPVVKGWGRMRRF